MKQIIQNTRTGSLSVKDVPAPTAGPKELLVRTTTSLISSGTERLILNFGNKTIVGKALARPDLVNKVIKKISTDGVSETIKSVMSRLDLPLPLGYSAAGTILHVGKHLEGEFRVGERVAICGAGIANHAEINAVPRNLAASIPADVSDEEACYGTIAAIALHAVRNLGASLGENVAVLGLGLVGQLACQFLRISGARVIALDFNEARLKTANTIGVENIIDINEKNCESRILSLTKNRGCDGILIAASTESNEPFEIAANIARDRAKVCLVGLTGTAFPYSSFMKKELSIIVSRSYGPGRYDEDYEARDVKYPEGFVRWTETENLAESLRLMDPNQFTKLDVSSLTTHTFKIGDANEAYDLVLNKEANHLGVILNYPLEEKTRTKKDEKLANFVQHTNPESYCNVGMIGMGSFANNILLPELSRIPEVTLHTVVSKRGSSAKHGKDKFGFHHALSDINQILDNPDINVVIVATRHDSHAKLVTQALEAGKYVMVEKPLGIDPEEIDAVSKARERADKFFQVGFNRRFAPFSIRAKNEAQKFGGPKLLTIRVNAGPLPADSWIQDPNEGGGRIIGEMCHFIDIANFFVNSPISSVTAETLRENTKSCDNLTATLRFADGSLATITYTSLGNSNYPKEEYEIFSGGTVIKIDNFRSLTVTSPDSTQKYKSRQNKGVGEAVKAFVSAVKTGGPPPVDELTSINNSIATISLLNSLRTGSRINL